MFDPIHIFLSFEALVINGYNQGSLELVTRTLKSGVFFFHPTDDSERRIRVGWAERNDNIDAIGGCPNQPRRLRFVDPRARQAEGW